MLSTYSSITFIWSNKCEKRVDMRLYRMSVIDSVTKVSVHMVSDYVSVTRCVKLY
jgi:hypothetical protein